VKAVPKPGRRHFQRWRRQQDRRIESDGRTHRLKTFREEMEQVLVVCQHVFSERRSPLVTARHHWSKPLQMNYK
jgi:hypothetical protein